MAQDQCKLIAFVGIEGTLNEADEVDVACRRPVVPRFRAAKVQATQVLVEHPAQSFSDCCQIGREVRVHEAPI